MNVIVFNALNALFICFLDSTDFSIQTGVKAVWVLILVGQLVLGVAQMAYLFMLEDNEGGSGGKMKHLIELESLENEDGGTIYSVENDLNWQ